MPHPPTGATRLLFLVLRFVSRSFILSYVSHAYSSAIFYSAGRGPSNPVGDAADVCSLSACGSIWISNTLCCTLVQHGRISLGADIGQIAGRLIIIFWPCTIVDRAPIVGVRIFHISTPRSTVWLGFAGAQGGLFAHLNCAPSSLLLFGCYRESGYPCPGFLCFRQCHRHAKRFSSASQVHAAHISSVPMFCCIICGQSSMYLSTSGGGGEFLWVLYVRCDLTR